MSSKIEVDTKTFVRFWLVILGLGAIALFIWKASFGLLILGVSLFLAIAISPLVSKIADIIPGNEHRKIPTTLAYVLVVGALALILSVVLPAIVQESVKFVSNLPETVHDVTSNFKEINQFGERLGIKDLQGQITVAISNFSEDFVRDFGTNLLNSVGAVANFFAASILVLALTFLMLMDGPNLVKAFWRNIEKTNKRVVKAQRISDKMADVVAKYVSGALTVSLINGIMTTLAVFVLTLIFGISPGLALPFGLITGVMSLIPMFGSFIGGTLVAVLLAFSSLPAGIAFFVYCVVYLQIEANVISPRVQSKGMNLPALAVLAAVTIGVYMFGLIGAIVAIPVAGCIKVLIEESAKFSDSTADKK